MINENDKKIALDKCICRQCPSFSDCDEEIWYCVLWSSKCIKEKKWCICWWCPAYKLLKLKNYYFCIKK